MALCRYGTSTEEDRRLLSTVAPGSRMHKAILVRAPLPHGTTQKRQQPASAEMPHNIGLSQ